MERHVQICRSMTESLSNQIILPCDSMFVVVFVVVVILLYSPDVLEEVG